MTPRGRHVALLAAIIAVYLAVLGRSVSYEYVWDDVSEIQFSQRFDEPLLDGLASTQTERTDPSVTELVGVQLAYDSYRPLLFASYWAEVRLFGRSAFAMHVGNLLIGVLAILCVFAIARRWLASDALALVATALFALHPITIEPVVYVSGRGDLLAGLFAVAATLCVLHALERRPFMWTAFAAVAFAASLFTKESCLGLPVAVAGPLWMQQQLRARWRIVAVLFAVALIYLVIRRLVVVPTTSGALIGGLATLPGILLEYVRIVLLPFDLSTEQLHQGAYLWYGWAAVVCVVVVLAWFRTKLAPWRFAIAGSVWFVALLGPSAIAIAASTHVIADRYAYAPLAGLAIALVATANRLTTLWRPITKPLAVLAIAWGALLLAVGWFQVPSWRDNQALYSHAVAMSPDSSEAHYRLAYLYARVNDWDHAMPLLVRAVELDGKNVRALVNLGVGQLRTGDATGAEATLARAVTANPAAFRAWFNLGVARLEVGKRSEGCAAISRAVQINPQYELAVRTQLQRCR